MPADPTSYNIQTRNEKVTLFFVDYQSQSQEEEFKLFCPFDNFGHLKQLGK